MKYAAEMGSGAMICIPSLIKIRSDIRKLIGGIHRQHGDLISILLFFQSKESRLQDIVTVLGRINVLLYSNDGQKQ
jgi:hypothetical protein